MRVLSVIHYPVFGGPHNQAARLASPLERRGWKTLVVLPDEDGNARDRLARDGVEVVSIPLRRLRATLRPEVQLPFAACLAADVRNIRHVIRSQRVDLVQVSGLVNPHAAIAAKLEGRPVVWQILDTRAPFGLRLVMMPLVKSLADVVMCTGLKVAGQHPGAISLGDRLVQYVPPVDTLGFRPDPVLRVAARDELGVPQDGILVGSLGNLNPQKGYEHLLKAVARLWPAFPHLYVRILGASTPTHRAYKDGLEIQAMQLGLTADDRFSIIDPGANASRLLPALDIFALTSVSRSEGIPTVILEAMACGLPVVSTDVGGVSEVVAEARTGFLVPPGDEIAFVHTMRRLISDSHMRSRLGDRARASAQSDFEIERCSDTHANAYSLAMRLHQQRRHLRPARSLHG